MTQENIFKDPTKSEDALKQEDILNDPTIALVRSVIKSEGSLKVFLYHPESGDFSYQLQTTTRLMVNGDDAMTLDEIFNLIEQTPRETIYFKMLWDDTSIQAKVLQVNFIESRML